MGCQVLVARARQGGRVQALTCTMEA
jgi:hypothetical protein